MMVCDEVMTSVDEGRAVDTLSWLQLSWHCPLYHPHAQTNEVGIRWVDSEEDWKVAQLLS